MKELINIILVLLFVSCNNSPQKSSDSRDNTTDLIEVDKSQIATIKYDTIQSWIFENGVSTNLSDNDLMIIEKNIRKCVSEHNLVQIKEFNRIDSINPNLNLDIKNFKIELDRYKRQYMPIINNQGEKIVWINFFCDSFDIEWKKEIVFVKDGGNCYFQLKVNIDKDNYFDFWVNGNA
ncbi:hypothetical protein [Draconibacterium sediminis]|uniref:hypothetical protein n=1 Tax=Draconibacterium sediminis TaxID=1544798 RepID=UPI0026F0A3B3|nr:hypothetical protein [Draconibacterium sediminis]